MADVERPPGATAPPPYPAPADQALRILRPLWQSAAACRAPAIDFYSYDPHEQRAAKAICRGCTVAPECLAYALDHQEGGVWGGLTENERVELKRRAV